MLQPVPSESLELVKVLAPYATALVTILGFFLTTYLTQRNWARQFAATRASALSDERRRLLSEVPRILMQAVYYAQEALVWRAIWAVSADESQDQSRTRPYTGEAFQQKHGDATNALAKLYPELYALRIIVRVHFGEAAGVAYENVLPKLQAIYGADREYDELMQFIRDQLHRMNQTGTSSISAAAVMPELQRKLLPIMKTYGDAVASVVRAMVESFQSR